MAAAEDATKKVEKDPKASTGQKPTEGTSSENGSPGKKSLGPKEPPPFAWKLVGKSGGYFLTLFKAAEREDVDSQLQRLTREGYYKDLQVLDINAVIKQPNPPKPSAAELKKASAAAAAEKSGRKVKKVIRKPVIARPKAGAASNRTKWDAAAKSAKKSTRKTKATKATKAAKSATKKATAKKKTSKKVPAKKSDAKKSAAKKSTAKKAPARKSVKKKK